MAGRGNGTRERGCGGGLAHGGAIEEPQPREAPVGSSGEAELSPVRSTMVRFMMPASCEWLETWFGAAEKRSPTETLLPSPSVGMFIRILAGCARMSAGEFKCKPFAVSPEGGQASGPPAIQRVQALAGCGPEQIWHTCSRVHVMSLHPPMLNQKQMGLPSTVVVM